MPDATGQLTQADSDTIKRWWDLHWKAPVTCPVCKTAEWTIASHVVNIQRYATDSGGGSTYPHIVVTCKTCAHAMFFNAVQIGVSPVYAPPPQTPGVGVSSLFGSLAPADPLALTPLGSLLSKK
jgi:hypothetical protein